MKFSRVPLTARTGIIAAVAVAAIGVGGLAFADGGVPLVTSSPPDTTTTAAAASPTAANSGQGTNNVAVANNTKDGKTVIAISLKIVQTNSSTVDATNAAVAAASCSDCQTVAIALEGVLVAGSPTTFDPTNIALALNSNCTNCQTLATAYQDVVQNDTRVRITGTGRQQIAAIRKDLDSLRNSGLSIEAIQQRVNDDAGRFLQVLQNDVVPIGRPAQSGEASTTTTSAPVGATVTTGPASTSTSTTASSTTTTVTP